MHPGGEVVVGGRGGKDFEPHEDVHDVEDCDLLG